jgi:glucose/arabinose dehydrogenase
MALALRTLCGLAIVVELAGLVPAAHAQTVRSGYTFTDERCGPYPKLKITTQPGYCAGLVAAQDDGLIFPRTLVQLPGTRFFVVVDMGGWDAKRGRVLLLDPDAPEKQRLKVLLRDLDVPHGSAVGIDGKVYIGAIDRIFRFDPLSADPAATVENILDDLAGFRPQLSDGSVLRRNLHPLKHFVFDRTGRIFVNMGAPSDACGARAGETKACAEGEGAAALASVWMFTPPPGGVFPALKPDEKNPPHEIYARGLRNSMALAMHPRFPDEGYALLQGENGRDFPELERPYEEINALERGKHYGWPYCNDNATPSPEYVAFLKSNATYRDLCNNAALYRRPVTLMPPHSAPLGMLYYAGEKFPALKGKLLVGLHGYRPTGGRVIVYDTDERGFPLISPPPVRFNVSCAPSEIFRAGGGLVPAGRYLELISGWHEVKGARPQGAPVGLTVGSDGAIWLIEDKNKTIIRIDAEPESAAVGSLACNNRTAAQVNELVDAMLKNPEQRKRFGAVREQLIEQRCVSCHAGFGIKPGMGNTAKDTAALRFILEQEGWVYPGNPEGGRLHHRVWNKGPEKVMPPDGAELIDGEPGYRALLTTLDTFVTQLGKR